MEKIAQKEWKPAGRLIDANKIIEFLDEPAAITSNPEINRASRIAHDLMRSILSKAPTVDAEPVKHGRCLIHATGKSNDPASYYCSVCHTISAFAADGLQPIPPKLFNRLIYHYCPHCGAKMDLEEQHDETLDF
jgi:hypothetical protein